MSLSQTTNSGNTKRFQLLFDQVVANAETLSRAIQFLEETELEKHLNQEIFEHLLAELANSEKSANSTTSSERLGYILYWCYVWAKRDKENLESAAKYLKKSATLNNPCAIYRLAFHHMDGEFQEFGIIQNRPKGLELLKCAAFEMNYGAALAQLGIRVGMGVEEPQDPERGILILKRCLEVDPENRFALIQLLIIFSSSDPYAYDQLFDRAFNGRDVELMFCLAFGHSKQVLAMVVQPTDLMARFTHSFSKNNEKAIHCLFRAQDLLFSQSPVEASALRTFRKLECAILPNENMYHRMKLQCDYHNNRYNSLHAQKQQMEASMNELKQFLLLSSSCIPFIPNVIISIIGDYIV